MFPEKRLDLFCFLRGIGPQLVLNPQHGKYLMRAVFLSVAINLDHILIVYTKKALIAHNFFHHFSTTTSCPCSRRYSAYFNTTRTYCSPRISESISFSTASVAKIFAKLCALFSILKGSGEDTNTHKRQVNPNEFILKLTVIVLRKAS